MTVRGFTFMLKTAIPGKCQPRLEIVYVRLNHLYGCYQMVHGSRCSQVPAVHKKRDVAYLFGHRPKIFCFHLKRNAAVVFTLYKFVSFCVQLYQKTEMLIDGVFVFLLLQPDYPVKMTWTMKTSKNQKTSSRVTIRYYHLLPFQFQRNY